MGRRAARALGCCLLLVLALGILSASATPLEHAGLPVRLAPGAAARDNSINCNGAAWNNSHLWIGLSGCQAGFWGQYEVNNSAIPNETNGYNFSFAIDWVAEFTPSGQLVRLASPLNPVSGRTNVTVRGNELNLSMVQVLNVTNASGLWNPNDTWYGSGAQWNISNVTVGTIGFTLGVQLNISQFSSANSTGNSSSSVKFDVGVSGWPWTASTDRLGFVLSSLGAWGSHFTFNASSSTLAEKWNSTNRTFLSVVFGGVAGVTYHGSLSALANVEEQAGLFYAGIPDREAAVLVSFVGVAGNYSQVAYDPWVVFSIIPPMSATTSPTPGSSGTGSVALVGAAAAVLFVGLAGWVVRAERLRRQGAELVRGMKAVMGPEPGSKGPPR